MSHEVTRFQSFVGVDLHKCTVTLVAVDASGADRARLTISTKSVEKIERWLLALPRPSHLAVDVCPFVEWFIDRYRPCVDRIDIADATELANHRGKRRKNDPNDVADDARPLARGEGPLGFIADPPLMQTRKLGRFDGAGAQRWPLAPSHLPGTAQQRAFADFLNIV
jgi:hypothetical protein